MSSKDKNSYVIVDEGPDDFFADQGASLSAQVTRPEPEPEPEPKTGKSSKKSRSPRKKRAATPTKKETEASVSSEYLQPMMDSSEPIVGLMLWPNRAVASVMEVHKGKAVLKQAGELLFPEDSEDAQRSKLLKKWWKSQHFGTRSVWVGLGSSDTVQKYFSHEVSEDELHDVLGQEAEEAVRESAEETSLDYYLFDKKTTREPFKGMLSACPRWGLVETKKLLQGAGLLLCGFGVPAVELAKTFRWLGPTMSEKFADCVLLLTESSATIMLLFGENSFYSRRIEHGSDGWEDQMDYMAQSLNDVFMYFQLYLSDIPVGRLHLAGVMPKKIDMTEFLLMETGLAVDHWDPLKQADRLVCSSRVKGAVPDLLVSSLGLALRRD